MAIVRGAHLVGSAPVATAAEMFTLACEHLGGHLRRVGDGEVGERNSWIRWQFPRLGECDQLELKDREKYLDRAFQQYALTDPAADVQLVSPGYADAAIASYRVFAEQKEAGNIPPHVRFMVGLPTPLGVVTMYIASGSREKLLDAYGAAMNSELATILDAIPHAELAIQWEVCIEFGILENLWTYLDDATQGEASRPGIAAHVIELGNNVPVDVELGYHLCYGDAGHQHFVEPQDTTHLAWAASTIVQGVDRRVDWIHLPVPRSRDDESYFAPLAAVDLPEETDLYLGLVHATDGTEGTQRRIAAAASAVPRFGVATECGLGRRPLESIAPLMQQHAAVAKPVT